MDDPVIEVTEGKLQGGTVLSVNKVEYFVFRGVPYATPPVGELRFRPPLPAEPWEGVRNATKTCNICAQYDMQTSSVIGNEDCLYLNVYALALPPKCDTLQPVIVFFHGGGFIFGSGTDDSVHGPDFLVEKGVIVVSFNYRLGILGFLSLDHKDAPGNMGLRDQVQALKWVQQNISKFGGDPNNVTLYGISAGGASVEYLMLSPMARGLFHKAIAQSGSSVLPWAQNTKIKKLASKIPILKGKVITDIESLLKYLKDMPLIELISSSAAILATVSSSGGGIHFGFVPTVERPGDWEPFIDRRSYDLLKQGEFTKVPFMTGFCSREGLLMIPYYPLEIEKLVKENNFLDYFPFLLDENEKIEMLTKLRYTYLEKPSVYNDAVDSFAIDYFSDVNFIGGGVVAASLVAKRSSPVYLYEFSYDGSLNYMKKKMHIQREGACHGDDGGYLIRSSILPTNISDNDRIVRNRMVEMWYNFAKYGNPTPKATSLITTKWKPIAETGFNYLFIDDQLTMKTDLYPDRIKLFEEAFANYRSKD